MFAHVSWVTRPRLRTVVPFALLILSLLATSLAQAQSSSTLRRVASPAEPGRGHLDLDFAYLYRQSAQTFAEDGMPAPTDPPATYLAHEALLLARYGLTDRTSVFFHVPVLYPLLDNQQLEEPLHNPLPFPGDVSFGMRWRLFERLRPFTGLTLELRGRVPTGLDASGPAGSTLLTGTGIPELGAALAFRRSLGLLAVDLSAGYTARLSEVVAYAEVLHDDLEGDARFHPGNQIDGRLSLEIQPVSWLWLDLEAHAAWQDTHTIGTTSTRWFPSRDLEPIDGSSGLFADAGLSLWLALSKRLELSLGARYRFLGRTLPELAALGLETFSPPPGWSGGPVLRIHL